MRTVREAARAVRIVTTFTAVLALALALFYASTVPEWCDGVAQRVADAQCATSGASR